MSDIERSLGEQMMEREDERCALLTERAIVRVTEQLQEAMDARGLSRADLARKLGRSKGWVTQLLDGENNKTIRTIAYVFAVIGADFETSFSFPAASSGRVEVSAEIRLAFDLPQTAWAQRKNWESIAGVEGVPRFDATTITRVTHGT